MPRFAALIFAALLGLASPALAVTETLTAGAGGHFITTAEINGRRIGVLVDTGASAVVLSYEDARRAGINPASRDFIVPVSTANGEVLAAAVILRRVAVGRVRVQDVEGLVMPRGAMKGSLLGMSFLTRLKGYEAADGELELRN